MTDIYRSYFNLFGVYSAMGEKDKAIENLRKVIKYNDLVIPTPYIAYLKNHPMFDTIRDEPEYHEFIKIAEESFLPERKKIEKLLQEEGIFQ
jgi:tetratricopeptide (TPR) repeat protein